MFAVGYRMGGPARFEWRRTVDFATRAEADKVAAELERAGYKALVYDAKRLDAIGLPETWSVGHPLLGGEA